MFGKSLDNGSAENINALDKGFKEIMSDSYILSNLLGDWVDEFHDSTPEEIRQCLPTIDGNRKIVDLNSEHSSVNNGSIFLDKVFRVDIKEKNVKLIIGIEGQGDPNPGYSLEDRALYYACRMISDQKGTVFDGDDYSDMQKVYSIWCVLDPPRKRNNTVIRYTLNGRYDEGYSSPLEIYDPDRMEIVFVNISDVYEANTSMGLMNTLFNKKVDDTERIKRLKEDYKIPENESLFRSVCDMSKTLDEQFRDYYLREGFNDGREQGSAETTINLTVELVHNLMSSYKIDADDAMDALKIPEDIREKIRDSL